MAEKIQIGQKEPLYKAAEKINNAMDEVNTFQTQIDQLVIEGDSSVEAAQARVDAEGIAYTTLKERLDTENQSVTEQLAQKANSNQITEYSIVAAGADNTGVEEVTQIYNALNNKLPEGSRVVFPPGVYKGHIISHKNIIPVFQDGVTLINANDTDEIIGFRGTEETPRSVVGNPVFGNKTFEVSDATGLQAGDIGYLVDDSVRPGDLTPDINVEMLRIKSVSGTTISVYDKIRSDMNTGAVRFIKINPVKKPKIIGSPTIKPTSTHGWHGVYFEYCDEPSYDEITVKGFTRHGVRFKFCYRPRGKKSYFLLPIATESGQGYGVSMHGCRSGKVKDVYEEGCRHAVDMSSSYKCVADEADITSDIYLSHNGYGGYNKAKNITAASDNAVVTVSKQGIADESKHVARGYEIENVDITVPTATPDAYAAFIYFQSDFADILIRNIKLNYLNTSAEPGQSNLFRFGGNPKGGVLIDGVRANVIGNLLRAEKRDASDSKNHVFKIDNVQADKVNNLLFVRGYENIVVGTVRSETTLNKDFLFQSYHNDLYKVNFDSSELGNSVKFEITGFPTYGLFGKPPKLNNNAANTLLLAAGGSVDEGRLLNSSELIVLRSGSAITMSATTPIAPPKWAGQTVKLLISSNNADITIPTGTNVITTTPIVMKANGAYEFVAYNGSWYLKQ